MLERKNRLAAITTRLAISSTGSRPVACGIRWATRTSAAAPPIRETRETALDQPGRAQDALRRLREAAMAGGNLFAELMEAARYCSLGQITEAFFEVGGKYRRNV